MKAYKNYDTLEKHENARAWLYQIAHRVALDDIRRRRSSGWSRGPARPAAPRHRGAHGDGARLSGPLERALAQIPNASGPHSARGAHDLTGLELAAAMGVSHVAARAI